MADLFSRSGLQQDTGLINERWGQEGSTLRDASATATGAVDTILTVTAGKTYFLKSISYNSDTGASTGSLLDAAAGKASLRAGVAETQYTITFDAPMSFTTNVNFLAAAGTWNVFIVGWEEDTV